MKDNYRQRNGFVLLVTLVLLVVLAALGYTLSSRVTAQRHRCRYITDYQTARYGCDSGIKCALAVLEGFTAELVARPNEPDFSDLFAMTEEEYQEYLAEWAEIMDANQAEDFNNTAGGGYRRDTTKNTTGTDFFDIFKGDFDLNDLDQWAYDDANGVDQEEQIQVRGPYGAPWPLVAEPIEFEVGSAKVRIEIEDENAKYPVTWMMIEDEDLQDGILAGFEVFCEWMGVDAGQIELLESQMGEIDEIKPFKTYFKQKPEAQPAQTAVKEPSSEKETAGSGRRLRRSRRQIEALRRAAALRTIPESVHRGDYIKLLHSSLIDTETLAMPTILSESRKESALKYLGMWSSKKVNINSAPRHVLEAAFAIGGDAEAIAEEIIQRRKVEPFKDIEKLRSSLLMYSDSIQKCENFIMTTSNLFTVRVTAISGGCKVSSVIAVVKSGTKVERLAVING